MLLLIGLILIKPRESLIHKSKNLSITIGKLTRVEKHVHFEQAHNQPPSKLQIRISNDQSQLRKGTNKHSKEHDKENNVWDVNLPDNRMLEITEEDVHAPLTLPMVLLEVHVGRIYELKNQYKLLERTGTLKVEMMVEQIL